MILDVQFEEKSTALAVDFGEITDFNADMYEKGYEDGQGTGYQNGYADGLTEGKQIGVSAFWNAYCNASKTDTDYMFAGQSWTNAVFTPPAVTLKPTRAMYMFSRTAITGDLAQLFANCGFTIDFSQCTYIENMFTNATGVARLGVLDFSGAKSGAVNVFINATRLQTIDKLIIGENTKTYTNWFNGCSALENLTIEGVIDKNGFSVQWSPKLTHDSLISIINVLKDLTGSGTAYTVTLGTTNLAKLTDVEKAIATQKGWTLA